MPKQLTLSERIVIERMIQQNYTFATIARHLGRSASTISREVLHYRCFINPPNHKSGNDCIYYAACQRNHICPDHGIHDCYGYRCKICPNGISCMDICGKYTSLHCTKHDKPPYVCSACSTDEQKNCRKNHAYYTAHRAHTAHKNTLRYAHSGIRKSPDEIVRIGNLIKPLIKKGQSLNHICTAHAEDIGLSKRSLYNYIDNNVFEVRNIDLPRKVVYRKRRERKVLTKMEYRYRIGRTYNDFQSYLAEHPKLPVVEMDTVKGSRGKDKVLLTMIFRQTGFMLIFLMPDGTQNSVANVFDALTDLLGTDLFRKLFPIILTDNGVEFKDPERLEYTQNGYPRSKIFFCDPQASWQKPLVENNHRFIRRISPRGTSFHNLTAADVKRITCHINSVIREQLDNKTPFALMASKEHKKLLFSLNLSPIPPDEVILNPELIKH